MAVGETARLVAELDLKDNFSRGIGTALGSLGRMQSGLGRMARGTGQVASGLDRLGTRAAIAAAGGLAAVVKTSADFELHFAGIRKTVDGSEADFAKLEDQLRGMARRIPVSFEDLADIGAAGGALGIAKEDLLDFTDVVARLAVSTNLSSDQASTALGQLGNVLHLRGQDFRDFADSLVNLGNKGASTEQQIVDVAARFGAAGNAAGLSKEEILGLSSAVASMGIQTEAAGSSLSRIFNSVATNIGTSSAKAEAFADTLGLSAKQFHDAWQKDAVGTFEDFLKQLNKLDQFEAAKVLKSIGVTNTRDVAAVRLMAQNYGFVADQIKVAKDAHGALNKESQQFFDTASGQWKTLINIFRDSAATIGDEVLPVTKDLIKQLSTFLNTPEMRARLKEFGQNLAGGIKDVVHTLQTTDFSGLIEGMKTAGEVAKTAFGIFRSLPPQVQALAISAIALNKVSGGAVGSIAKGLGNIFAGALQTLLPGKIGGVAGGLLGGRGSTPANPLFVSMVGPGAIGGPGAVGGSSSGGGFWKGVGVVMGAAAAAELGNVIGHFVFDPTVKPAVTFEQSQFDKFLNGPATQNLNVISHNLLAVNSGIQDIKNGGIGRELLAHDQLVELERQRDVLEAMKAEALKTANAAQDSRKTEEDILKEAKGQRLATNGVREAMTHLTLEQRLIRDKGFKAKLDADEFIKVLKRTSEFGGKGGTSIEHGPTTGRDPTGQAFVALVRRLEPAALHSPVVLGEIKRHIIAAEEVQRQALRDGDVHAAKLLQRTIDALHGVLHTKDKDVPPAIREGNRKADATKRAIDQMHARTVAHMQSILSAENRVAGNTGVIARQGPPRVSVTVNTSTNVSVDDVIRSITHTTTATGSGPGGPAPVGII